MRIACVLAAGLALASGQGLAAVQYYDSDADFIAYAAFTKVGGANVRWGNGGASGDWEYAVVNGTDSPLAQGQIVWSTLPDYSAGSATLANTGFTYRFTATGTQTLELSNVGGLAIGSDTDAVTPGVQLAASASVAPPAEGINTLVVRARAASSDVAAVGPGGAGSGFRVNFSSGGFFDMALLVGDADAEYAALTDDRLAGGFWIIDEATLRDGSGSLPMWQFKVGLTPVPAPASLSLLLVGLSALALASRRRPGRGRIRSDL